MRSLKRTYMKDNCYQTWKHPMYIYHCNNMRNLLMRTYIKKKKTGSDMYVSKSSKGGFRMAKMLKYVEFLKRSSSWS
jgi:hypothetical protein